MKTQSTSGNADDPEYDRFLVRVGERFTLNTERGTQPVFTTDVQGLFEVYLSGFRTPGGRQHHNCRACQRFIETYGGLVTIDVDGLIHPAIWHADDAPPAYRAAIAAIYVAVRRAKVTGVHISTKAVWGEPETGVWKHFHVRTPPSRSAFGTMTADQLMAERREDFKNVRRALGEYKLPMLEQAVTLLESDALYRAEHVIGPARWLRDLHKARDMAMNMDNVLWRAIACAPAGFCHPRSSMIGTLLDDLASGAELAAVAKRFALKMNPTQYQRPQAPPKAGAIDAAEKLFAELGLERSLKRRFARLDDIVMAWRPTPKQPPTGGVFGHLRSSPPPPSGLPPQTVVMSWEKFQRTVLPKADAIKIQAPSRGSYSSFVTAVDPNAPPILQWDTMERRNSVSWYFWNGGSLASQFNLNAAAFHTVTAISLQPSMWFDPERYAHHGQGVMFVIEGAKDSETNSSCLFPEILKSELRPVRSVIEAHSNKDKLEGKDDASAAGLMFKSGNSLPHGGWDCNLRVSVGGINLAYRLDRWD